MKFLDVLQLILITLKLLKLIDCSWGVVLIPLWITIVLCLLYVIGNAKDDDDIF